MENRQQEREVRQVAVLPTAFKKEATKVLQMRRAEEDPNLWRLEFSSGGQLPRELRGLWRDDSVLIQTVDKYLEKLEKRKEGKDRWDRHHIYYKWKNGNPWR